GLQGQIVNAFFQGHNPAIEQSLWADLLAAKVVNEKETAVGLQLERGLIEACVFVEYQIEGGHSQLAAHNHNRAMHLHPASIGKLGFGGVHITLALRHHRAVAVQIEQLDYLPVGFDGVWYRHIAAEHGGDTLREQRLAVAWSAK